MCHSVCANAWKNSNNNFQKELGINRMGGGLEFYALVYWSVAGCIEYGNSCWFRNASEISWLNLKIKAGEITLVRAGLDCWLFC